MEEAQYITESGLNVLYQTIENVKNTEEINCINVVNLISDK